MWFGLVWFYSISTIVGYLKPNTLFTLPSRLRLQNTPIAILQMGTPRPNECPAYNTKPSDCKVPVILELWEMQSTPWLSSLSGPLWPGVVAHDNYLSMGKIELNCILVLNWIARNRTALTSKLRIYAKLNCSK